MNPHKGDEPKNNSFLMKNEGQGLLEVALITPVLMALLIGFFAFIYEQLWTQVVEHLVHELSLCDQTMNALFCLEKANFHANRYNLLGTVVIYRSSENQYTAELIILKDLSWKTLTIQTLEPGL